MTYDSLVVISPSGTAIKCRNRREARRVKAWAQWVNDRQAERNRRERADLAGREPMRWVGTGKRKPLALRVSPRC